MPQMSEKDFNEFMTLGDQIMRETMRTMREAGLVGVVGTLSGYNDNGDIDEISFVTSEGRQVGEAMTTLWESEVSFPCAETMRKRGRTEEGNIPFAPVGVAVLVEDLARDFLRFKDASYGSGPDHMHHGFRFNHDTKSFEMSERSESDDPGKVMDEQAEFLLGKQEPPAKPSFWNAFKR